MVSLKDKLNQKLSVLVDSMDKLNQKQEYDDNNFWTPQRDKTGNGFAIIRFLPPIETETKAIVDRYSHAFKNPSTSKWYIELSRTSLGESDPLAEYNSALWNSSSDDDGPERRQVRNQKRKHEFITNAYVIKDSVNPENEGKVVLYKFGKKILDKIESARKPKYDGDTDIVISHDLFENGANFRISVKMLDKFPNYDDSTFGRKEAFMGGDEEKIQEILDQCHPLAPLVAPEAFKTYEDLKKRLNVVLGLSGEKEYEKSYETVVSEADSGAKYNAKKQYYTDESEDTTDEDDEIMAALREQMSKLNSN